MNCTIVVEMKKGNNIKQRLYQFDDYRVAIAICNLMDNIENVAKTTEHYRDRRNENE